MYTREQAILAKHLLGDGVILMVFNALQLLRSIQLQHYIYNANGINISANLIGYYTVLIHNHFYIIPCIGDNTGFENQSTATLLTDHNDGLMLLFGRYDELMLVSHQKDRYF